MNNLTLEPSGSFPKLDETPSYFQYQAQRTLPRDKKLVEFHRALKARYDALALEHAVRSRLKRTDATWLGDGT